MGSGFSEEGLQTPPRYSLDYKRLRLQAGSEKENNTVCKGVVP